MFKIRKNVFETNSSSTHALILTNEQYNEDVDEGTLLTLVNLPELEADITVFTGDIEDMTYDGRYYNTYEGSFTTTIDKLRYLYTCLCQDGLYKRDKDKNLYLDNNPDNKAYIIYQQITKFLPKINFIKPKDYIYIFEDCNYIVDELLETGLFENTRTLGLFLLKGQVVYCSRDTDEDLSEELHQIARTNKYSICISG